MLGIRAVGLHNDGFAVRLAEALLAGDAPFALVDRQLLEGQHVVFAYQLAQGAGDLQAVGAGGVAGGGDEHAGRAVGELQEGGHVILDLHVMPLALVGKGMHLGRQAAQPLQQIQLVGALVEQHAATLALPGGTPCTGVIVVLGAVPVGDDPVHALDLADLAAVDHFLHLAVDAVGALIEHHRKHAVRMLVRSGHHVAHLQGVHAGRLLAQHVQTSLEGLRRQGRMLIMGRCDQHRVTRAGLNQLAALGKDLRAGHVLLGPGTAGGAAIRHGSHNDIGASALLDAGGMAGAHVAHADDTKLQHNETSSNDQMVARMSLSACTAAWNAVRLSG